MPETPFFFPSRGQDLFAVLHAPERPARRGFVFCHPFAEEKLWAHRVFVSFARELAQRGIAVLRFDEAGHGDSSGRLDSLDLQDRLVDLDAALATLRQRQPDLERVGLLGLRLGATLGWLASTRGAKVDELVLWEPLVAGGRYMQEVLMRNLSTQLAVDGRVHTKRAALVERMRAGASVNSDGYPLHIGLYDQLSGIDLLEQAPPPCPCLLVQMNPVQGRPAREELSQLAQACPRAELATVVEQPFWREIKQYYGRASQLFQHTLNWLEAA